MQDFIKARAEFYRFLYGKFLDESGPYCGTAEFEALCQTSGLMARARLFAADLGHITQNRLGWLRLTAQGILYAEEQGFAGGGQ